MDYKIHRLLSSPIPAKKRRNFNTANLAAIIRSKATLMTNTAKLKKTSALVKQVKEMASEIKKLKKRSVPKDLPEETVVFSSTIWFIHLT